MSEVAFIRRNGRIIPIKKGKKGKKGEKKRKKGKGASQIAAGLAVAGASGVAAAKSKNIGIKSARQSLIAQRKASKVLRSSSAETNLKAARNFFNRSKRATRAAQGFAIAGEIFAGALIGKGLAKFDDGKKSDSKEIAFSVAGHVASLAVFGGFKAGRGTQTINKLLKTRKRLKVK